MEAFIYTLYSYFNKNKFTFTFIQDEFVTADTLAFIYYTMLYSIKNEYKIDFDDMETEDFVEIIVNGLSLFICQELEYNQKRLSYYYNDRKEYIKLFFQESFEDNKNEQKSLSYLIKFANLVKFDKKELHFKKFEDQNDSINSFLSNNLIVEASELYMITRHLTGELLLSILEINEKESKTPKNTEDGGLNLYNTSKDNDLKDNNSKSNVDNTLKENDNKHRNYYNYVILCLIVGIVIFTIIFIINSVNIDGNSSTTSKSTTEQVLTTISTTASEASLSSSATPKAKTTEATETTKSNLKSKPLPQTGEILIGKDLERGSQLTIHNASQHCYVKLKDRNYKDVFGFFVRANGSVTVDVPQGYFYVYFASGDTWYGKKHLFGDNTICSKDPSEENFYNYTMEYTLKKVAYGNFNTESINIEEFN